MIDAISVAEAKARFAECLRTAEQGQPVVITRHGKRVAALVAASALADLERLRAAGPDAGLAGLAGGWKGSEQLVGLIGRTPRTKPRRRARLE